MPDEQHAPGSDGLQEGLRETCHVMLEAGEEVKVADATHANACERDRVRGWQALAL